MSTAPPGKNVAVIGGGLVGSLLALFLQREGYSVTVFERFQDLRKTPPAGGRSINLVLTRRGLAVLREAGVEEGALALCVPVKGRLMHSVDGDLKYQPYGLDSDWNNSISRTALNQFLVDQAEKAGVQFVFESVLTDCQINTTNVTLTFADATAEGDTTTSDFDFVFGADGVGSVVRSALQREKKISDVNVDMVEFGYKELLFPAGEDGEYTMDRDSLHIWPRGSHFLMGLADLAGSFTGTVYLPMKGEVSFESLTTAEAVVKYFEENYADAIPLLGGPDKLAETFLDRRVGELGTVRVSPWHAEGRVLLVGDAAHGIVPFFGQGCNCGFEDCTVLMKYLATNDGSLETAIKQFGTARKVDTDAIADMALDNFVEMRDRVKDDAFLLRKAVEHVLEEKFPLKYRPRYAMVVFSSIPYSVCEAAGKAQQVILDQLCTNDLKDANNVDLAVAEKLIDKHLSPIIERANVSLDF